MRFTTGLGLLMGIALGLSIVRANDETALDKRMTVLQVQKCTKQGLSR